MAVPYKIAVAIAMSSNHNMILSALSSHMLRVNTDVDKLTGSFGRLKMAISGAIGIAAGTAILGGLAKIAEKGSGLLDQQMKLVNAGVSHAMVANLTADAYERIAKAVPTASVMDVLRTANELRMVTGSLDDAAKAVPKSLMLEALVGNATGKSAEGQGYDVWRALEMKGVSMDEHQTDSVMGKLSQMIIASGGKIAGSSVRGFAQQAGPAWQLVNDHAMGGSMPYMINEMGGEKAGTGWNRMYNTLNATRRWTRQQYNAWKSLGLIDQSQVLGGDQGGMLNFKAGGPVKGAMENIGDMGDIISKVIKPALDARGITDPVMINAILAKLFPDSTAARLSSRIYQQLANIEKDRINVAAAHPLTESYNNYSQNNPKGVEEAYEAQKKSMLAAIGAPIMQAAIPVMKSVTGMFSTVGQFANSHPEAIKIAAEGLAALGVALAGAGGAALMAALGPVGWAVGIGTGLAALAAYHWDDVKNIGSKIVENLEFAMRFAYGAIPTIFSQLGSAILDALKSIIASIPSALGGILGGGKGGTFGKDLGDANKSYVPMNFTPGQKTMTAQPIQISMNVDGRSLGQAVSEQLLYLATFSGSAPSANGRTLRSGGDHNYSST